MPIDTNFQISASNSFDCAEVYDDEELDYCDLDWLEQNKLYLFHGTPAANVESIIRNGFDVNRCVNNCYGKGIYLTESSQKADQYTDAQNFLLYDN